MPHRAFMALANSIDSNQAKTPNHYKEAVQSFSKEEWLQAMTKEIGSLIENKVWELVPIVEA